METPRCSLTKETGRTLQGVTVTAPRSCGVGLAFLAALSLFPRPAGGAPPEHSPVTVLIYHEIVTDGKEPGETVISLENFKAQMRWLSEHDYQTLSMDDLVAFLRGKRAVPEHSVVLTFDDGWKSVLRAVPVLNLYGFKASFWIITGKGIGGDYLEWSDIAELAKNPNFEIGSHTVTHPWDPKDNLVTWAQGKTPGRGLPDVWREISESKQTLEDHLGKRVRYLAWPCGWYTDEMTRLAHEAGYEALLTAEAGPNLPGGSPYRIKRVFVDGACDLAVFEDSVRRSTYHVCQKTGRTTIGHLPPDS